MITNTLTGYSTMHDNDPEVLEREKRRNLSGEQLKTPHIKNAPGWNQHLATSSEVHVKVGSSPHPVNSKSIFETRQIKPTSAP